MITLLQVLHIKNREIALHIMSIMLQIIGAVSVLGFFSGMPKWTWPITILSLSTCFYAGYYFEIGFRTRRLEEFRYGVPISNEDQYTGASHSDGVLQRLKLHRQGDAE